MILDYTEEAIRAVGARFCMSDQTLVGDHFALEGLIWAYRQAICTVLVHKFQSEPYGVSRTS